MRRQLNEFDAALEKYLAQMAGESVENRTRQNEGVRIHYQSTETAVIVPITQALVTGLFIAAAVGAVVYLLNLSKPWAWALLAFVLTSAGCWLFLLRDWRGIVLHRLETITDRDLDGDLIIGAPQKVRVEIAEDNGRKMQFVDLPGDPDAIEKLAAGLLAGKALSEGQWTGAGAPFTRAAFVQLRDELILRGLAEWIVKGSPTRGARLTSRGRAVMRYLSNTPTPSDEDYPESE